MGYYTKTRVPALQSTLGRRVMSWRTSMPGPVAGFPVIWTGTYCGIPAVGSAAGGLTVSSNAALDWALPFSVRLVAFGWYANISSGTAMGIRIGRSTVNATMTVATAPTRYVSSGDVTLVGTSSGGVDIDVDLGSTGYKAGVIYFDAGQGSASVTNSIMYNATTQAGRIMSALLPAVGTDAAHYNEPECPRGDLNPLTSPKTTLSVKLTLTSTTVLTFCAYIMGVPTTHVHRHVSSD